MSQSSLKERYPPHLLSTGRPTPKSASSWDAPKEPEAHQGSALATEVGRDVKKQAATKAPRAKLHSAKPTVEERDASTWDVQKALKEKLIIVYLTAVEDAVGSLRDAVKLRAANQGYASNTAVVKGVGSKDAQEALRDKPGFVSPTVVGGVVSLQGVQKVLKGVQITAKPMAVGSAAYSLVVLKEQKVVLRCAKLTVEGNVVCLMEVGFVLRVSTVGRVSA